jgi:hypothetical protein
MLSVEECKREPLDAEPAVTENSENAPANHQSLMADPKVPEAEVQKQPSLPFVPPPRPTKRPRDDSDTVMGIDFSSEDDIGKKKKSRNYKCGEKNCSYAHDEEAKMSEHLDWHLQMLTSCETCQAKQRGPIDGQIHRAIYKEHAEKSLANMVDRVIQTKKKKEGEIVCNLEFDGATCESYKYSSIQTMSSIFLPFVDMTYKNKQVKPIDWQGRVKRYICSKKPKSSHNK